jgi:hypothetical protein
MVGVAAAALAAGPVGAAVPSTPTQDPTAVARIGLRLVDIPAAQRDDPRAQIYIVDHLAPGTVIHRRIEVSNFSASRMHVGLYSAAATLTRGAFLGSAGRTRDELSTWTSISPTTLDVKAAGRVTATVTVAIPHDAAPGERYGVVWAEVRSAPSGGAGITQVSRVGIRVYLSVGPGGPPASNFAIESLIAGRGRNGRPMVLAGVHNTGGRALDMSGTLQLSNGPGRLSAGPFPVTLGVTLAIGDTEPVTIGLDNRLPAGPWDAAITLHSGLIERTAHATITFPNAGASAPVTVTTHHRRSRVFTAVLVVTGVAAVAALLLTLRPRRRRSAHTPVFGLAVPTRRRATRARSNATRNRSRSAAASVAAGVPPRHRSRGVAGRGGRS